MISAGDFRNGITFEMDGNVVQVIEFQHVKPGKGAAFVRTKYKNVITGAVVERSFNPTDKYPTAYIERRTCSICTATAICTTSWTWKLMSSSRSTSPSWVRLSSSSRKTWK